MTPNTHTNPVTALETATFDTAGYPEVTAAWLAQNRAAVRLIDVREPHELAGPLGHIEGAENIPLLSLLGQASSVPKEQPLVLVCRSGNRSALAATCMDWPASAA